MKRIIVTLLLLSVGLMFMSCGEEASDVKTAKLVYVNWEEGVAYTHLAKVILEEKLGFEVEITAADVALAFASVSSGDQDAFMETWLPGTHDAYMEQYGENFENLGAIYKGTTLGLAVPQYMYDAGITRFSDLASAEAIEKLDATITGIDSGAGMMIATEERIFPEYGLDDAGYTLLPSSGPAMMAALKEAYDSNEWIVVTAWKPHSMFGYFEMQFLEQDGYVEWSEGDILLMGREGLTEEKPELARFLGNMELTTAEIGDLMVSIKESDLDTEDAAREWMNANEDVIADWIQ